VVVAIIAILAAMLLPVLSRARATALKAVCLNNHKQGMVAMLAYGVDYEEFPGVLDWSSLDGNDLPNNRGENISDNQPGGLTLSKDWARFGVPVWVLLRQQGYIGEYRPFQCAVPSTPAFPYYNRHLLPSQTAGGYLLTVLSADTSMYTLYENPSGGSLAIRNHGCNPFDLYPGGSPARSASQRGLSVRDKRDAANFAWTVCPGRFESQAWNDPTRPGSTFGGYGYEPHMSQPLSTLDPLFGGVSWAEFWDRTGTHYVERVVGYGDGHAVYDHQMTPHNPARCPEINP